VFRRLLRHHLQVYLYELKTIVTFDYDKFLPDDGAISAETCRLVLILIHVFIVNVHFVGILKT
jgi:hypothetical protein